MSLDKRLKRTAVIGAAGKMGRGISLLLLQEIARCEAENLGAVGSGEYRLLLVDTNEKALFELRKYLRQHLLRYAEKSINLLRSYYAKNSQLVSNEEIIRAFVEGAQDCVFIETDPEKAKSYSLIFEAILEDVSEKTKLFRALQGNQNAYFFSNTSAIPIAVLNKEGKLHNRIVGFHFYNPPPTQPLLEFVAPENTEKPLCEMALELAKRLNKTVVHANDVAGFIGNGHFMRELLFACKMAQELSKEYPLDTAAFIVNALYKSYLLRPMGIFDLREFVGIDVCAHIMEIMRKYLPDPEFKNPPLRQMSHFTQGKADEFLVEMDKIPSWKDLKENPNREKIIQEHLDLLAQCTSRAGKLASQCLEESRCISQYLVQSGVANSLEDVHTVLKKGFQHLYV